MIVSNNQQQLTRLCGFQKDFVVLQSPLCNNGNQARQAILIIFLATVSTTYGTKKHLSIYLQCAQK